MSKRKRRSRRVKVEGKEAPPFLMASQAANSFYKKVGVQTVEGMGGAASQIGRGRKSGLGGQRKGKQPPPTIRGSRLLSDFEGGGHQKVRTGGGGWGDNGWREGPRGGRKEGAP